jgi:pullulanase/glycogen debranching enzyme
MDSLRYWVEMHVEGFRFDAAAAPARQLYEVNQLSAFFEIIHQDPVISQDLVDTTSAHAITTNISGPASILSE